MSIINKDKEYVAGTYARFPLEISEGNGALMYDEEGNEYIDLGSGIAVNSFGVADEEWLEAITVQASMLGHTSNLYYTEPCAKLAKMDCGISKRTVENQVQSFILRHAVAVRCPLVKVPIGRGKLCNKSVFANA